MMWLLKIPGVAKLGALLAVVVGVMIALGIFGQKKKAEGRQRELAKQMEEADEARKKMEAVPDSSRDDTVDKLRDGDF